MIVVVTELPTANTRSHKVAFRTEDVELMLQEEDGTWRVWLDIEDEDGAPVELLISADDAARIAPDCARSP